MENEDAFAAEARDKATLSRRRGREGSGLAIETARSSSPGRSPIRDSRSEDEESPLLPGKSARARTTAADEDEESYHRAINEPWLGAQGSEGLLWHKKPSVRSYC
jgi:hypothetical protein